MIHDWAAVSLYLLAATLDLVRPLWETEVVFMFMFIFICKVSQSPFPDLSNKPLLPSPETKTSTSDNHH